MKCAFCRCVFEVVCVPAALAGLLNLVREIIDIRGLRG